MKKRNIFHVIPLFLFIFFFLLFLIMPIAKGEGFFSVISFAPMILFVAAIHTAIYCMPIALSQIRLKKTVYSIEDIGIPGAKIPKTVPAMNLFVGWLIVVLILGGFILRDLSLSYSSGFSILFVPYLILPLTIFCIAMYFFFSFYDRVRMRQVDDLNIILTEREGVTIRELWKIKELRIIIYCIVGVVVFLQL